MEKHHELHVILEPHDAELLYRSGLPEATDVADDCANCGTPVGDTGTKFMPFALILDSSHYHFLCLSCSAPVTRPRS